MTDSPAARAQAAVNPERCVELARALVQCDTQNPPGGESSVIPLLTETLRGLGARTEVFEPHPGRPSLLATVGDGATVRPTLLVNGHTDVVPAVPSEWADPPFAGIVRDGKLFGRGACDMKGGIAAAIEGLHACLDAGVSLPCDLVFHLVADEETGGRWGTEALLHSGRIVADAAIIPEPSELQVCIAERGVLMAELTVIGRAAHGSDPSRGRSAVADGARIATTLHMAALGDQPHPLLGTPTCNVGVIAGGTAANVVAGTCVLRVDRRVLPGQSQDEALASLRTLLSRATPDVEYQIDVLAFAEASELDAGHPFVRLAQAAGGTDNNVAALRGLFLGTDARFIRNQRGIPAVVYGPGSMTVAHAPDEFVPVSELRVAAQSFAKLYTMFDQSFVSTHLRESAQSVGARPTRSDPKDASRSSR